MKSNRFILAVSPYHLSLRDPAAMAALLLADRVVTYRPSPSRLQRGPDGGAGEAGRAVVAAAVERAPWLLRMMEAWRWSMPLWRAGVVDAGVGPDDAGADVDGLWSELGCEAGLRAPILDPIRALLDPRLQDGPDERLDRVCADVARGGVDPGIGVMVTAGLDRFAHRRRAVIVRAGSPPGGGSVTQRAEAAMGRKVFAVALPVLVRASGERVVRARESLRPSLEALRPALAAAYHAEGGDHAALADAAATYADAFGRARPHLVRGDDDEGFRVQDGLVSLSGVMMPADAAIRSGLTAARVLLRLRRGIEEHPGFPAAPRVDAEMETLVIRAMNVRPAAPGPGPAGERPPSDRRSVSGSAR